MKAFLLLLLGMLRDFVTSKKVLTAILTGVAGALIKDPAIRDRVVAVGLMLLGGQALTDHGKAAAEVQAAATTVTTKESLDGGATRVTTTGVATAPVVLPQVAP